jgi:hypothetical protein
MNEPTLTIRQLYLRAVDCHIRLTMALGSNDDPQTVNWEHHDERWIEWAKALRPQLPADDMAKLREENKLLIDEVQAHAEVSLAAIDARAQAEHELATAEARIEELERERNARYYEGLDDGKATVLAINGPAIEELRQRATAAEAERDRLREVLPKLTLKWRIDDFNGKNFPTKREAAYEVEAALKEPTDA